MRVSTLEAMPLGLLLSSEEERGWERIVRPMAELSAGMEHDMAIGIADEIGESAARTGCVIPIARFYAWDAGHR